MNGSYGAPYTNPKAPVHIITGTAVSPAVYNECSIIHLMKGCRERHNTFRENQPDWVALTNADYGYTRMTVHNGTHISFEQISDDQVNLREDRFLNICPIIEWEDCGLIHSC